MESEKVSIVVPVHNRAEMVSRCVRSIRPASLAETEIVVVDDASTDRPEEALAGLPLTRIVRLDRRSGPAAARNAGIRESRGKWLIFLDSDCWTESPGWIDLHLAALQRDPRSVLTGGVMGVHRTYGGAVDSYMNWFMFAGSPERSLRTWHLPMTNVSMRRETFDRVGAFRESLQTLEDVDWSYRARSMGTGFSFIRGAAVFHQDREGLQAAFEHQRRFGLSQRALRDRHPGSRYSWLFPRTVAGGILMGAPIALLMTLYVVGRLLRRDLRILWYAPGIFYGHCGHALGVIQGVAAKKKERG